MFFRLFHELACIIHKTPTTTICDMQGPSTITKVYASSLWEKHRLTISPRKCFRSFNFRTAEEYLRNL